MPLAQNTQQVLRKQTNVIDYSQTNDDGYTELAILEAPHNIRTVHTEGHTVYQQHTTKSRSCSKTNVLLVICVVIAIIAMVGVSFLAVLYVKEIESKKTIDKVITDNFIELDISSSHAYIFASSNKTMMSNTFFDGSIAGPGKRPLKLFQGIVADRSISKGSQLDIRFKVEYKIVKEVERNRVIFAVEICNLCSIDKHLYGRLPGINCWVMLAAANININSVQLSFQEKGKYSSNKHFVSLRNVGTTTVVSYHIHVNGQTNSISYNDLLSKHFNTFTNVNFSEPLYISFGLYNAAYFQSVFQFVQN